MIAQAIFDENELYTAVELRRELNIGLKTYRRWCKTGKIPPSAVVCNSKEGICFRRDVIDPLVIAGELVQPSRGGSGAMPEPRPEELIRFENFELLPEHFERYMEFRKLREKEHREEKLAPPTYVGCDVIPASACAKTVRAMKAMPLYDYYSPPPRKRKDERKS